MEAENENVKLQETIDLSEIALRLLVGAFELAVWFKEVYGSDYKFEAPTFIEPEDNREPPTPKRYKGFIENLIHGDKISASILDLFEEDLFQTRTNYLVDNSEELFMFAVLVGLRAAWINLNNFSDVFEQFDIGDYVIYKKNKYKVIEKNVDHPDKNKKSFLPYTDEPTIHLEEVKSGSYYSNPMQQWVPITVERRVNPIDLRLIILVQFLSFFPLNQLRSNYFHCEMQIIPTNQKDLI
jgi:hypothetical protein